MVISKFLIFYTVSTLNMVSFVARFFYHQLTFGEKFFLNFTVQAWTRLNQIKLE